MAAILATDTKPEMLVRKVVFSLGYRYRLPCPELARATRSSFPKAAEDYRCARVFLAPAYVQGRGEGQQDTQQLKLLCRQRRFIIHQLANAKRRLTGLIDLSFPEFSRHFKNIHSQAAHAVLKAAPNAAAIGGLSLRRLQGLIARASRGRFGAVKAKALKKSATESLSARHRDPALDLLIHSMIAQLDFFQQQLAQLDLHIQRLFRSMAHPIKTIPGIGPITGPLIVAELGDLRRFAGHRSLHALLAYARDGPPSAQKRAMERQNQNE